MYLFTMFFLRWTLPAVQQPDAGLADDLRASGAGAG